MRWNGDESWKKTVKRCDDFFLTSARPQNTLRRILCGKFLTKRSLWPRKPTQYELKSSWNHTWHLHSTSIAHCLLLYMFYLRFLVCIYIYTIICNYIYKWDVPFWTGSAHFDFSVHTPGLWVPEVNLMVGCLMPAIADRSRTANVKGLSHLVENEKSNRWKTCSHLTFQLVHN